MNEERDAKKFCSGYVKRLKGKEHKDDYTCIWDRNCLLAENKECAYFNKAVNPAIGR